MTNSSDFMSAFIPPRPSSLGKRQTKHRWKERERTQSFNAASASAEAAFILPFSFPWGFRTPPPSLSPRLVSFLPWTKKQKRDGEEQKKSKREEFVALQGNPCLFSKPLTSTASDAHHKAKSRQGRLAACPRGSYLTLRSMSLFGRGWLVGGRKGLLLLLLLCAHGHP